MLAQIEASPLHWGGFIAVVLVFLALDLGVFHRHAHVVRFREAVGWTAVWFTLAMVFGLFIAPAMGIGWGKTETEEFITGYVVEFSLSMDNVFVIAVLFGYFKVEPQYQHRVLFWGIVGALVMRGIMIGAGTMAIQHFHWLIYVFGAFLLFTGVKLIFTDDDGVEPEKNPVVKLARKFFPVTKEFHGHHFMVKQDGKNMLTPLALVLIVVETTDLVFAVDSLPAIFAITTKPFVVFTSNVCAILGLRSLYFLLAGAIGYFRYLKFGLSFVLIFIGCKMMLPLAHNKGWLTDIKISSRASLYIVAGIIAASIVVSLFAGKKPSDDDHQKKD